MNTIYLLLDPRTALVRYVGITSGSLPSRLKKHLHMARRGEDTHRSRWIRALLAQELLPIMWMLERAEDRSRESFWIAHYRHAGVDLTNTTDGGDGLINPSPEVRAKIAASVTGFRHTPEARAKISASLARQHAAGLRVTVRLPSRRSPEQRQRIAASLKAAWQSGRFTGRLGCTTDEATRRKISLAQKGKPCPQRSHAMSEASRAKISAAKQGNTAFLGRRHSPASIEKISRAQMGNTGRLGKPHSAETKAKISARKKERDAHRAREKGG